LRFSFPREYFVDCTPANQTRAMLHFPPSFGSTRATRHHITAALIFSPFSRMQLLLGLAVLVCAASAQSTGLNFLVRVAISRQNSIRF
jgi:hypothetical protein